MISIINSISAKPANAQGSAVTFKFSLVDPITGQPVSDSAASMAPQQYVYWGVVNKLGDYLGAGMGRWLS